MKMTEVYKLADDDMRTYGGRQWELGVRRDEPDGYPLRLCRPGCLHCYASPVLAAFLSPGHGLAADYTRCFRAEAYGETVTDGTKIGARSMMLIEEVEYPQPTTEQRVYFAILCARAAARASKAKLPDEWEKWADAWIDGADRSSDAADKASAVAAEAAVATNYADYVSATVATVATYAADAAAAAAAAYTRADSAAYAADVAAIAQGGIDLVALAKKAIEWNDPAKKGQR
jgi:hypothetical protein